MRRPIGLALVDLSGTIHIEDAAIKGSIEALARLKSSGIAVRFVTNTTKEPIRLLHERLTRIGFHIEMADIFTSLTAARRLVDTKKVRPFLMLEDVAMEDFHGVDTDEPNAVVIGLAPSRFSYEQMNKAFALLLEGAPLIAIHKARYYQKSTGLDLGPGPFVEALEYASGVKAEVVGKPERQFFHQAIGGFGVPPEQTVMIGDDARDDVSGAIAAGMIGVLVKTGKYRVGDEFKYFPQPSAVCGSIVTAVDWLLDQLA